MSKPSAPRAHPHLYEVHTWLWLEELSRRHGRRVRLGDVPASEWDRLERLGFDLVWLMGIWERSPEGRAIAQRHPDLARAYDRALPGWRPDDVVGSPYAVRAYAPDPHLGDWGELDRAREALHRRGMGLILDFVPNHTARDHDWVGSHPERYVHATAEEARQQPDAWFEAPDGRFVAHGRDPHWPGWTDTAQIDHFHPDARRALLGELRRIAEHCDGVRCDVAMLVLNEVFARTWSGRVGPAPEREFWSEAIERTPELLWIAEVYWGLEGRLQELGFDFAYDKGLYDDLRDGSVPEVARRMAADPAYQSRLVRFLENHDEARAAATFAGRERAAAALALALPGMRFVHHGQLEGRRVRVPVQLGRAAEEPGAPELTTFYERLLRAADHDVFHRGRFRPLAVRAAGDAGHGELLACEWRSETALRIVVANLGGGAPAEGRVVPSDAIRAPASATLRLEDLLTDAVCEEPAEKLAREGLHVRLGPGAARCLAVAPPAAGPGEARAS